MDMFLCGIVFGANAYAKGAKVTHDGKRWVSTADTNTWAPGVYGWEEAA